MKLTNIALGVIAQLVNLAYPFPRFSQEALALAGKHTNRSGNCPYAATNKLEKRQSGFDPSTQKVSTTGANAWVAPNLAGGDQRGPCPGLNALVSPLIHPDTLTINSS